MKVLVVIDMQNDFIYGVLGTDEARNIVDNVVKKIKQAEAEGYEVFFTQDSHFDNYLETQEGKNLPIKHCIMDSPGWNIIPQLKEYVKPFHSFFKTTFGLYDINQLIVERVYENEDSSPITDITLIGVCTDICVISNAIIMKGFNNNPEHPVNIHVDASCCAGTTPENHKAALQVMKSCQIIVEGE